MRIRYELSDDITAIRAVVTAAFASVPQSNQTEPAIIDRLRSSDALVLSLVAVESDRLVGHIAFSQVAIAGQQRDWYGLGPVAVDPRWQGRGIGQELVRAGLERLQALGANGCVLVGEPKYYSRFGFRAFPQLSFADVPHEYFLALPFRGPLPAGPVQYHKAFDP